MTESEARDWLARRVPRGTLDRLDTYVARVIDEAKRQNLISAATIETIWSRHVVDSAQLVDLVRPTGGWLDLGSGAGFPGMVVGIIDDNHAVTLAETRPLRFNFLRECVAALDLGEKVSVHGGRVERLTAPPFAVISARAFAPLDRLFASAAHLADLATCWVLPKGRGAQVELEVTRRSWQGDFTVVPSLTDPEAAIIQARNVRPIGGVRQSGSSR